MTQWESTKTKSNKHRQLKKTEVLDFGFFVTINNIFKLLTVRLLKNC